MESAPIDFLLSENALAIQNKSTPAPLAIAVSGGDFALQAFGGFFFQYGRHLGNRLMHYEGIFLGEHLAALRILNQQVSRFGQGAAAR